MYPERTLGVFDQAEHASNPDQHAARVKRVQAPRPKLMDLYTLAGRHSDKASVEDTGCHDEAGEEEDLDHETADDDVLAGFHG